MNRTDHLSAALRTLDAADPRVDAHGARARADLEAILATDPGTPADALPAGPLPVPPGRRRTGARRAALLAGATAALAGVLVLVPATTGGDRAFATWTAAPDALTAQQRTDAVAGCRDGMREAAGEHADALAAARPAVAERRGVWTTVVLAGAGGFHALCVTDSSAGAFTDGMIGSVGVATGHVDPGPREVRATDLGTGSMSAGDVSLAAGAVGAEVVGVTYASASRGDVVATVAEGRFALWLPGDELRDAARAGAEVRVTYRDGTTGTARLTL
ncbi:hypothetical protein [Cellulomonas sp.]|uniref:hypothetical protein n=1 Tax=Cellulomonas sp. TaxID=40001 RepID=UPI00281155D8|nr:hypothetical protein [Cellulomonas sp.]